MQMVRGEVPGGYNLAVGEPLFLQEIYGHLYPRFFNGDTRYPPLGGDQELISRLRQRYGGQHVVITNGAKQALLAGCYALQVERDADIEEAFSFHKLYHGAPFWPTYPTIADFSGLGFTSKDISGDTLNVITAPNNPNGSADTEGQFRWHIWDAAYASPVYGWDGLVPYHRISVWSAAKLYGISGYRLGWLVTPDAKLASLAAEYVEKTTSGVATPSQAFLRQLLENLEELPLEEAGLLADKARRSLRNTSLAFMKMEDLFSNIQGFPANGRGMFAWVRASNPGRFDKALERAKVRVVGGVHCGGESDYYRISFGVTPATMRAAIKAIREAY